MTAVQNSVIFPPKNLEKIQAPKIRIPILHSLKTFSISYTDKNHRKNVILNFFFLEELDFNRVLNQ